MKPLRIKILGLTLLLGGLVLCGVGLRLLLSPAQYQATAITSELTEVNDSSGSIGYQIQPLNPYDQYIAQTIIETIQSPAVLSNAVVKLNLNQKWGGNIEKSGFADIRKTINLLKTKLLLFPVRGGRPPDSIPEGLYRGIAISVTDTDASEAAAIANAVAEAYIDFRINRRDELFRKGLETLRQQYQDEEKRLSLQPTNREQLLENHKLLAEKIEAETMEWKAPRASMVQIVDRAEPPQFPTSPNRPLGAATFAIALFPLLAGILLLKPSRNPAV